MSFRGTQGHTHAHELFQLRCTGNVAQSKGNFLSWKEFTFCLDIYMTLITMLSKLFVIRTVIVERRGSLETHTHGNSLALSSARHRDTLPGEGTWECGFFAVEDMQQLVTICMASVCPCSSFSCPAADLCPGFGLHLGCIWATFGLQHAGYVRLVCCTLPVMHISLVFAIFFSMRMCFLKIRRNHDLIS